MKSLLQDSSVSSSVVEVHGKRGEWQRKIWIMAVITPLLFGAMLNMGFIGAGDKSQKTCLRSAVGAQEPRKVIGIDGISIAYTDTGGEGPVIVCLHAIGHGARDFESLSERLRPQYRVIALDFPGQGNSGEDSQPASGTRYSALLSEFINRLHLNSVTLIGNSIGGAVSIRYANQHPDRVKALVLCDTGGLGRHSFVSKAFIGAFVQFFAAGRRGAFWFPWAFEKYYRNVLVQEPAREERERIIRSAYEVAPILEQAWTSFAQPEENLENLLPSISAPVLIAWAKRDAVIPLKISEPSFAKFPNYRLEVFDGGHAAFLEDPDKFEIALRQFLSNPGHPDRQ